MLPMVFLLGITIAAPVQVSKAFPQSPHNEVQIAADPVHPDTLIGCAHRMTKSEDPNRFFPTSVMVYSSFDGGLSWAPTGETPAHDNYGDPVCNFGPDGTGYWMSFSNTASGRDNMPMYRSTDGAKSWSIASIIPTMDREYITVDNSQSQYRGRVYVHGTEGANGIDGAEGQGITIFNSSDRGKTWEHVTLQDEGDQYLLETANGIVNSKGMFGAAFGDLIHSNGDNSVLHPATPDARLKFISSSDGGHSFTKASIIEPTWYMGFYGLNGLPQIAIDASNGPFHDAIYAIWLDARNGRGELRFSKSADAGKTWSPSVIISDNWTRDPKGESPDVFLPALAVNRSGVIGVTWYDRRNHPDRIGYDIRFTASMDGGDTFSPSVLVAPGGRLPMQSFDEPLFGGGGIVPKSDLVQANLMWSGQAGYGGDTAGMTADASGAFHPLWISRVTGTQQMWTTKISVPGVAAVNGGGALARFSDLSGRASVRFISSRFDPTTNVTSITTAITNTSKQPISGAIVLRLRGLHPGLGTATATNATNGATGVGATWQFQAASASLAPKAYVVRELHFKLSQAPVLPIGVRSRPEMERSILQIDAKLLGN